MDSYVSSRVKVLNKVKEKVSLYDTNEERDKVENEAQLFSIIQTIERVEVLNLKEGIKEEQYKQLISNLMRKYENVQVLVKKDPKDFCKNLKVKCDLALKRIEEGLKNKPDHIHIAETVQFFITALDLLKLEIYSNDEVLPVIDEICNSLGKLKNVKFKERETIFQWEKKLKDRKASENLTKEEARQLAFDLENAYSSFMKSIG